MRKSWFDYGEKISSVGIYNKLPEEEKNLLNSFKDYMLISAGQKRVDEAEREVLRFREITGTLLEIDLEDLRHFLKELKMSSFADHTKNKIKDFIHRFLKWKFKDWSERFNEFEDIKMNGDAQNKKPINSKTILTQKDIELLLEKEPSLYWKTFLICQAEGGLRTGETRALAWSQINFEDDGFTTLNIPSKKNRNGTIKVNPVYVKVAGRFLKELKEQQEKFNIKSKWVFPSPQDVNKHASNNVNRWFNDLCKKVLGRSGNNYMLRHRKVEELKEKISKGTLSKENALTFMRHSEKMFDKVYSGVDEETLKQLIKKQIYNTEELTKEEKDEIKKLRDGVQILSSAFEEILSILINDKKKKWSKEEGEKLIETLKIINPSKNYSLIDDKNTLF